MESEQSGRSRPVLRRRAPSSSPTSHPGAPLPEPGLASLRTLRVAAPGDKAVSRRKDCQRPLWCRLRSFAGRRRLSAPRPLRTVGRGGPRVGSLPMPGIPYACRKRPLPRQAVATTVRSRASAATVPARPGADIRGELPNSLNLDIVAANIVKSETTGTGLLSDARRT